MRRTTALLVIMLLLCAPLNGAVRARVSGAPLVGAAAGQLADAMWLVRHDKSEWMYFAVGERVMYAGEGIESYAFIGRARCSSYKEKGMEIVLCAGGAMGREVDMDELWVEPDLSTAHLRFEDRRGKHEVVWTGEGDLMTVGGDASVSSEGAHAAGGAFRDATATATLFGRKMPSGRFRAMAALAEGAGAGGYTGMRTIRMLDDGSVEVTARFERPRAPD